MADVMVEVRGLTKTFRTKTVVDGVDFTITRGEIFGLIGRNGAGKSTLLKMIGGLVRPTSGEIRLFGRAADAAHSSSFERLGLLIEQPGLYPHYTAYRNLELSAISYGVTNRRRAIEDLLRLVGLDPSDKTKVKHYSMGMKQRLGIAAALLGSPDILVLDEPINGLDPQGIVEMRRLILDLNRKGLTIIISSHILEELSKVADTYAIIDQGKMLEVLTSGELQLRCEERIEIGVDDAADVLPVLEQLLHIKRYKAVDRQMVHVYDTHVDTPQIVKVLADRGLYIRSIVKQQRSLEQFFLERTEKEGEQLA